MIDQLFKYLVAVGLEASHVRSSDGREYILLGGYPHCVQLTFKFQGGQLVDLTSIERVNLTPEGA